MADKSTTFVSNVDRRTWDLSEYEAKAAELLKQQEDKDKNIPGEIIERKLIEARDVGILDRATHMGRQLNIERAGFYCGTCSKLLRDSLSYIDHCNGKKHQRLLGYAMITGRATLQQVKDRILFHKQRLNALKKHEALFNHSDNNNSNNLDDIVDQRLRELEARIEAEKNNKKQKIEKRNNNKINNNKKNYDEIDEEMQAVMGFSSFNTNRK